MSFPSELKALANTLKDAEKAVKEAGEGAMKELSDKLGHDLLDEVKADAAYLDSRLHAAVAQLPAKAELAKE